MAAEGGASSLKEAMAGARESALEKGGKRRREVEGVEAVAERWREGKTELQKGKGGARARRFRGREAASGEGSRQASRAPATARFRPLGSPETG